jgi:hypothetical protein
MDYASILLPASVTFLNQVIAVLTQLVQAGASQ